MKKLLLSATVLAVLSSSSCTTETMEIRARLQEAERLMNIAPDSSLAIINSLDRSKIKGKELKAETALIHSIALDKNAIDMTDSSIIAPALDYYSQKGTQEEKSRTFYYTARIHENASRPEEAMEWLIKAESNITGNLDKHLVALIYSSKGRIYNNLHDYNDAALNYSKAAQYHLEGGDTDRFASNKIREAACQLTAYEYSSAIETMESIGKIKSDLSINTLAKYYPLLLNISINTSKKDITNILNEYLQLVNEEKLIDWLTISRILLQTNDSESAFKALERHSRYIGKDARYYYFLAQAYESAGQESEALSAYKEYILKGGMIGEKIITQDTRFVEERQQHISRQEKAREKLTILMLTITVILLALCCAVFIIIAIRRQLMLKRNEQIILQSQLDGLMMEREELARTYTENEEGRRIISERLRIIDNFVFSDALQDDMFEKKASDTLKKIISDREEFIRQNRLIFNQSYPRFIDFLKTQGLTDTEIEHCCLYAIGLNGKMVTNFTNMKRHYHIGSSIRKKLGLNGHDTNISIYIKNLMKEYE